MLDIKYILNNKDEAITNLNSRNKDYSDDINSMIDIYQKYLKELQKVEELKKTLNEKSKLIGQYKRENKDATELFANIEEIKQSIKEDKSNELKKQYEDFLYALPNFLQDDTPKGNSDEDNLEVKKVGGKPEFNFEVLDHFELDVDLDFERGAKLSKSRFVVTKGFVARLERAIMNFMLDTHNESGYEEVGVPFITNSDSLWGSGQLPKFADDLFKIDSNYHPEEDEFDNSRDFYLIPTAEVMLANLHRNEILDYAKLTKKYTAYSQCFRKEAGSAGRDTRGLIRMHQFGKVELFKYTTQENSNEELETMVNDAERILQALGLHYRVVRLCSGDMGQTMSKTYDLEVWFPAQKAYREVSSCSNARDYQARRAQIRYKDENGKTQFVHMLNGSGMATGRILAAVLENYQNKDKTVTIPEVLRKYMC